MTGRVRNVNTSQRVLGYLQDHANIDVPATSIKRELGLEDSTVVSNAVVHLRSKGINIIRPMRGIYRYVSGPREEETPEIPTQKLYEYVGNSETMVIVRGEDNELYVVLPLVKFMGMDNL